MSVHGNDRCIADRANEMIVLQHDPSRLLAEQDGIYH